MMVLLKNEWRKLWRNWKTYLALTIGCVMAGIQACSDFNWLKTFNDGMSTKIHPHGFESIDLSIVWLGGDVFSLPSVLFYLSIPLLAVLPLGTSWYEESKSGYLAMVSTRVGRRKYDSIKWHSCFASGGLVIAIPMLLNLMIKAMFFPVGNILPISMQSPFQGNLLSGLFYDCRILYMIAAIALGFVWGGVSAVLAMGISGLFRNRILTFVFPLILFTMISVLVDFAGLYHGYELSPLLLMRILSNNKNPLWLEMTYLGGFYILALVLFEIGRRRNVFNKFD